MELKASEKRDFNFETSPRLQEKISRFTVENFVRDKCCQLTLR